jgi:hypothetical protein
VCVCVCVRVGEGTKTKIMVLVSVAVREKVAYLCIYEGVSKSFRTDRLERELGGTALYH